MTSLLVVVALALAGGADKHGTTGMDKGMGQIDLDFDKSEVAQVIKGWNEESRNVAQTLLDKYGAPDGVTKDMVVWMGDGRWYKTVVTNDPIEHNFPTPHKNVVTQYIPYRMPVDKIDDVARFNGAVTYDRVKGVLGVSSNNEATNFLTVNVVDDIVGGRMDVDAARRFYADTSNALTSGQRNEYTDGFRFDVPANAADPDKAYTEVRPGKVGS
ncbi:MAG: hypothetical protein ACOZNI_31670 [Myxococcota bacterium]